MFRKLTLIGVLVLFMGTLSSATTDPNPNQQDLKQDIILAENDSTDQEAVVENPVPKKSEEKNDEEEPVSILSVNILFEIINHLNLRDLFKLN